MPAQPNRSLAHGLSCLQALAAADGPIGSRQLARELDMEHTRVNRLLGTLAELGLAERTDDRRYQPGPGLHVLAAQSQHGSGLLRAAFPVLRELLTSGLGVALGVLWRERVCYLYHGTANRPIEDGLSGYRLYPASESSIGLVLLAAREPRSRRAVGGAALETIRRRGFASAPGGGSLAVPIGNPAIAGLAAMTPAGPIDEDALAARLTAAATRIASALARPTALEPT